MFNIGPLEMLVPLVAAAATLGYIALRRRTARTLDNDVDAHHDFGR